MMSRFVFFLRVAVLLAISVPAFADTPSVSDIGAATAKGFERRSASMGLFHGTTPTGVNEYAAPKHEAYLCFDLTSNRNDQRTPLLLVPLETVTNNDGDVLQCSQISDDHPFLRDTTVTVIIHATDQLWDHIEAVGLNILSAAGTATDPAPVRPAAFAAMSYTFAATPAGAPHPANFQITADDELVVMKGALKLQANTVPTLTIKAIYSPAPIPPGLTDDQVSKESVVAFSSFTYPVVLQKYQFNVDAALLVSGIKNPTFVRVETAATVGTSGQPGYVPAQYKTQEVPGGQTVMPALLFTVYIPQRAVDRPLGWTKKRDWIQRIPQPTFGISLTSPSTDFFVGGSIEVVRKVQFVSGAHFGKINTLVPIPFDDPTSSTTPQTTTRFDHAAFVGVALNLDFIKSAFGK